MDAMLHKRCAKFIYVVPEGLRELMSDISREVIRSQPKRIYTFIADYLDALMITRENARVAARLVDSIIRIGATTVELLERTGMTREEADKMAAIIQNAFKQYMASRQAAPRASNMSEDSELLEDEQDIVTNVLDQYGEYVENEEAAAEIIQRAFREFKDRHDREKQLLSGMVDWRVAARSAIYLYRKTGVTYEEANRAANLIKAAYKGYYTRRIMRRLLEEGKMFYYQEQLGDEEVETVEETLEYDGEPPEGRAALNWRDYLDMLTGSSADEATTAATDYDMTSTEVAGSIIDSMLHVIPSDTDADQGTGTTWTEGMVADQTYAEDMHLEDVDQETADYLRITIPESDMYEDATYMTSEAMPRSSLDAIPVVDEIFEVSEVQELQEGQEQDLVTEEPASEYTDTLTEMDITTETDEA